jgi:predicted unusual protein kinase regulating ubiquinone biosynthesis (AarF/ABC1/UbiB family)
MGIQRRAGLGALALAAVVGAAAIVVRRRRVAGAQPSYVPITGSRRARNARIARLGARRASATALHQARRIFATAAHRAELDTAHQLRNAADVAAVLGEMKGALAKLGQMASYLDETMPAPMREALASLQQDIPPMTPELAASVVRAELGSGPHELFAEWDDVPIAAASIGQVHRAITRDGRAVAVKVQYPGVDEAIRADLENTDMLFRLIGLAFPGLDAGVVVEELRERLTEELDYSIEAANQRMFADWYAEHPFIHVPVVVDELSTARVLTTELATGARFEELMQWSQHERNLAAETIFRFVFRGIYRIAAFNGDPHPGNYLFAPGGRVTFLDFGLVKHYTPAEVKLFSDLIVAMCFEHDIKHFRRLIEDGGVLQPGAPVTDQQVQDYFGHFYEFVVDDRPVTFDAEYASGTVRQMFDLSSPTAAVGRVANVPSAFVIAQRINLGMHAVLAQLHATANWRRIAEEIWPFVEGPPSTPLGELEAEWLRARPRAR